MKTMRLMNRVLVGGIIVSLMVGFIVPSSLAAASTYPDDGVWEDTFDDTTGLLLMNCEVKNKEIVLKQDASQAAYDFAKQTTHRAYAYRFFFFLPLTKLFSPGTHIDQETPLGKNDIINLKRVDQDYASRSSSTFRRVVVHHFRFYVDIDEEAVDYIKIPWYGKTDTSAVVDFYYWNSSYLMRGGWQKLGSNRSTGTDLRVNHTIPGGAVKYAIDSNHYLDISVVAYFPLQFRSCTLSSDYVGLYARTEVGYSTTYGTAETRKAIDPINISNISTFYWDLLAWDDYQSSGAKVRYHVLYANATGKYIEVENTTLPGNKQGFTRSPVSLRNLSNYDYNNKYKKIKIRANLTTTSPAVSPRIFSWAVLWQNAARWQDSFSTFYRIDQHSKITKVDGTIMISQIQDEWPVFGYNSENTRASNSKGASTGNLYWFAEEPVGGGYRNPVIGNGKVYIISGSRSLHQYNVALPPGSVEGDSQSNLSAVEFDYDIISSPALTDEYVFIATGQQEKGGHENHIYGYELENLTQQWDFSYGEYICYDASPVVVDNTLFISTWGGDNGYYLIETNRYTNNKLLALDLNDNGKKLWEYTLPAAGLSTPAVSGDVIIVTCNSTSNDSVFAVSLNGEKLWSRAVGAVAHASPVIYEGMVFVTAATGSSGATTTKIVALDIDNGNILWNTTLSNLASKYKHFSDSTPAVYDGVLYAASPNGIVHALYTSNGSSLWTSSIYMIPSSSTDVLLSSPAYADNQIYIGTPAGKIIALNAATGKTTWENETFPIWTAAPISGSPIVTNGLVFIADENDVLYSFGKFIASTTQVTGSIISNPIRLPEAYWWGNFYADVSYNASISNIKFKLLDENGNVLKADMANKTSLSILGSTLGRAVRLQADLSATNLSKDNPKLSRWYITLTMDTMKPFLDSSTFTPDPNGWLPEIVPEFSIRVKDNSTGLQVKSAQYTLKYTLNNVSQTTTHPASCTGENGTTALQTMTMDISALPFYENITSLKSITFSIADLAGNTITKTVTFKQDTKKPTSYVKTTSMKKRYTSSIIVINATANDTGTLNVDASGIRYVELFYRYSEVSNFSDAGDWILFGNSTKSVLTWEFNFSSKPNQPGGYFELCTVATDNAGHIEDFPAVGDVWFLYDWKQPERPDVSGETLWFKERPRFSVVFEDDYRLDTIQYHPNFETSWTTIVTHLNKSIYDTDDIGNQWMLLQHYWDQMVEGEIYYLYFRINDTLNNTLEVLENGPALKIRKDISIPIVTVDTPSLETEWSWEENFTISGLANDQNGSGIKEALLYYRFSEDKSNWSSWESYGDTLDFSPFEWMFNAMKGDGYYQMKISVSDYAGNTIESNVIEIIVASFPVVTALVLLGLVIVMVLISSIIFINWRKKKTP